MIPDKVPAGCRFVIAAVITLIVAACGADGQRLNEARPLVRRRADVPFAGSGPTPSDGTLAASRRMDEIGRLVDRGLDDQARAALTDYIAAGGDHPRAFFYQGRLLSQEGRIEEATTAFAQAVQRSPRWLEPRMWLARCYIKLDRLAAAESVYQELDRLMPEGPWGPYGMGWLAWKRGDSERGTALLEESLHRDPDHAEALRLRAEFARIARDPELEERLIERYLIVEPDDASARFRLGELAQSAGRPNDARRAFTEAWEMEPSDAIAQRLVELAIASGNDLEAERWRARAGKAPPKSDAPPVEIP